MELGFAIAFSVAFALTNGFHDAANAIATLVATRGARPAQAIALAAVFNMLGALLVGSAVADTIASIVTVSTDQTVAVIGAGVLSAVLWNLLTWWRGLPSSSAHALVGGLTGSAFAEAGIHAIRWGGLEGVKPVGVFGVPPAAHLPGGDVDADPESGSAGGGGATGDIPPPGPHRR